MPKVIVQPHEVVEAVERFLREQGFSFPPGSAKPILRPHGSYEDVEYTFEGFEVQCESHPAPKTSRKILRREG